jgi:hypothetical protein
LQRTIIETLVGKEESRPGKLLGRVDLEIFLG